MSGAHSRDKRKERIEGKGVWEGLEERKGREKCCNWDAVSKINGEKKELSKSKMAKSTMGNKFIFMLYAVR